MKKPAIRYILNLESDTLVIYIIERNTAAIYKDSV